MKLTCTNLGGYGILVGEIKELAQIYRFDDFLICINKDDVEVSFEIPSTEWLEKFSKVLNFQGNKEIDYKLRASGYPFHILKHENGVTLFVYDNNERRTVKMDLSYDEAVMLHENVLNTILRPFEEQGGNSNELLDFDRFKVLGDRR